MPFRPPALREDVLVSACFGELPADAAGFDAVEALARDLDSRFRFREMVVVAEESRKDAYLQLVRRVDNLRLLIVRDGTAFYRRREIAADEAIGDVVLLAKRVRTALVDPVEMIERAADDQRAVLAIRAIGMVDRGLAAPLVGLGRMAGFKVGLRDSAYAGGAAHPAEPTAGPPDRTWHFVFSHATCVCRWDSSKQRPTCPICARPAKSGGGWRCCRSCWSIWHPAC